MAKKKEDWTYVVDPSDFISDAALEAIDALEGHPKDGVDNNGRPTNSYGVTNNGLAQLKELNKNFHVYVPKELLTTPREKLTREQCKQVASYVAVHNSLQIDAHFGDQHTFLNLPLHIRSAVLTDYHTGGTPHIADSWKDPNAVGSIMKAFETGSREKIALALISNADGSIIKYKNDKQNGKRNRHLAAVRLMYDTDNKSFPDRNTADKVKGKWQNQPGYIDSVAGTLRSLDADFTARRERGENAMMHSYYGVTDKENKQEKSKKAVASMQKEPTLPEIQPVQDLTIFDKFGQALSDFTNGLKNLFTNTKEDNNAVTGNQNVNMQ